MGFLKQVFKGKESAHQEPETDEKMAILERTLNEAAKEEEKKMDAMSRQELIAYNAETRVTLHYAYGLITEMSGIINEMLRAQNLMADEVLRLKHRKK